MVFSRGKIRNLPDIYYGDDKLEVVFEYTYLGIVFSYNGSFNKAIKRLNVIANRAMFDLIKKGRKLQLDNDIMLKMFDATVLPIALYGSEIWGFSNLDEVERLHLKFCKIILKVRKSTPNVMIFGELGRYPLSKTIKCRMLNFWLSLLHGDRKLSTVLYGVIFHLTQLNETQNKWLLHIENILNALGLTELWLNQGFNVDKSWFRLFIKQRLSDQEQQNWIAKVNDSPKCINYRMFKTNFGFENYLNNLSQKWRDIFVRFRCRNHKLPIEKGCQSNIPRNERICILCNREDIGDEFHYIFECPHFSDDRNKLVPKKYTKTLNSIQFCELFASKGLNLVKLCKFIDKITTVV